MCTLREILQSSVDSGQIPGAVGLVARGGRVEVEAVGSMDVEGTRAMRRDSILRMASLTKPILAAATMALVDDGRFALDDPVARWLPELASPVVVRTPQCPVDDVVPARRPITVEDLLTFRGGYGFPSDFSLPVVGLLDLRRALSPPAYRKIGQTRASCCRDDRGMAGEAQTYPSEPDPARVEAVCVVHRLIPGHREATAIDKRPRPGAQVDRLGLRGDRHVYRRHGGPDAAVYVYAGEDADWWSQRLGRPLPPGWIGENLRTRGLDVTGALIGERWRIGEVVLEVRKPRTPCENLSFRMGQKDFHLAFNAAGRVGAMCEVLQEGAVEADQPVLVEYRPPHEVTIGRYVTGMTPAQAATLLDSGIELVRAVRAKATRAVRAVTG